MNMEEESTGGSGIINWLAKLTRKVTSATVRLRKITYGSLPGSDVIGVIGMRIIAFPAFKKADRESYLLKR